MSKYHDDWDLTSIPDPLFQSEVGRRRREKGGNLTPRPPKIKKCANGCGTKLNATQRRSACPGCGFIHPRR